MKTKIVIFSKFNSDLSLSRKYKLDTTSREWIERRIEIFTKYTRVSFENQTNQDFLAVLTTLPESMEIIEEVLAKYPPLPANIIFTPEKNKVIEEYIKDADNVYIVHTDSDDMYALDFIEMLKEYHPKPYTGILICQEGYSLNDADGAMFYYYNRAPGTFTEVFSVRDYLEVYQYYPMMGHATAIYAGYEVIPGRMMIITLHGDNTWQRLGPHYNNKIIKNEEEKLEVLRRFKLLKD